MGSEDVIWRDGSGCPGRPEANDLESATLVSSSPFITADCVFLFYFLPEVKRGGDAEKRRGLLKVRAGFLRCSGGHPSSNFTWVQMYRSVDRYTE